MVGNIRVVRVRAGEERRFESLFAALRQELRRSEPGCMIHALMRSRLHPRSYLIHEQYLDPAALAAHQHSPAVQRYSEQVRGLLEQVEVEYFDPICD